jgi:hypothetical protein
MMKYFQYLKESIHEIGERIRWLEEKHPKFTKNYLRVVGLILAVLVVTFVVLGIQNYIENKSNAYVAEALAEYQKEQDAIEQQKLEALTAERNSEQAKRAKDIEYVARVLSGIDSFVESYGYSEGDLLTYGECVINRVINTRNGFPNTIEEVVEQEGQWTGYSEAVLVQAKYRDIATIIVNNYYDGIPRPCSADYCWAELRRDGIWLKNEYGDNPYYKTWRYTYG